MNPQIKTTNLRRHIARQCAVQALYQWQHTQHLPAQIINQFIEDDFLKGADHSYFVELLEGTILEREVIDQCLLNHLDRPLNKLNPVELAVLRVAVFELQHVIKVPYRVVINEAVEIAKEFGAVQGHKYVNAILDRLAPEIRVNEARKK